MGYSIWDFLKLIGSLALFLYGMQLMSSSLQRVAGSKLRAILSKMTSNKFMAVFTGFLITAIIQSSSATTVMVVSFVNAGLLTLIESIGLIMGSNIGTTFTAWLISLLGFKVEISTIALMLLGLCLPLMFSKNKTKKAWSEIAIGFAILFIGLGYLKDSVPDIENNSEILHFLNSFIDLGFFSTILFMIVGTLLTVVIQSSSATMAITLILCNRGIIPFEMAAAMVLGENIGTTITANVAAAVANSDAKRAARAHLIFNLIGVCMMLLLMPLILPLIAKLNISIGTGDPYKIAVAIPVALAMFHTMFNVANTFIQIWFIPQIAAIVTKLVPDDEDKQVYHLNHISTGILATPELSLIQAKNELIWFGKHTKKMFFMLENLCNVEKDKDFNKIFDKIEKYESISNNVDSEIANYLAMLSGEENSEKVSARVRAMFKISNEIESVADSVHTIVKLIFHTREYKITFTPDMLKNIQSMYDILTDVFDCMIDNLSGEYHSVDIEKAQLLEGKVNRFRDYLKKENFEQIKNKRYAYKIGSYYNDIFSECERMADYIINVHEAIDEVKNS